MCGCVFIGSPHFGKSSFEQRSSLLEKSYLRSRKKVLFSRNLRGSLQRSPRKQPFSSPHTYAGDLT